MKLCIYLPDFHLQAALRGLGVPTQGNTPPPTMANVGPAALLDTLTVAGAAPGGARHTAGKRQTINRGKARITQRNAAAAALGVLPGMTATQGQARHAALLLLNRNPGEEAKAQAELLDVAAGLTRDFESTADGICTLDLMAVRRADPDALGRGAVGLLKAAGLKAQAGAADNPDLALLVARRADPVKTLRGNPRDIREFLAPLPVETADPPQDMLDVLRLWGTTTLGDLTRLPRDKVTLRLGARAGAVWDRAAGKCRRLLRLVRPTPDFSESLELDHGICELEPLLFLLQRLLETLGARLEATYLVAAELRLGLVFEDGSHHLRPLRVPDPSRDLDLLLRLLETHLDGITAGSPVVALSLEAVPTRPGRHQFHLFESGLRDPNRFAETLARLEALLGPDRVGTPEPLPTHRPDAFSLGKFCGGENATPPPPHARGDKLQSPALPQPITLGLPLRRFRPPPSAHVETTSDGVPVSFFAAPLGGRLTDHLGPWRASGDWWQTDTRWAREEWDVKTESGGLYRLAHLETGAWVVEGIYG